MTSPLLLRGLGLSFLFIPLTMATLADPRPYPALVARRSPPQAMVESPDRTATGIRQVRFWHLPDEPNRKAEVRSLGLSSRSRDCL
jgi:hypothetical protein